MNDLIEALTIFAQYQDTKWPTICVHDTLIIADVEYESVSDTELSRLDELGFFWSDEYDAWASFRYGSA